MLQIQRALVAAGLAALALSGCGIGYNQLLFVTKSNVGVDFDATPPTAEIAVSRVEGVVQPTFEDGKTLPVMSSFSPESKGLFAGRVGQTFATGDAALTMARLYDDVDQTVSGSSSKSWAQSMREEFDARLALSAKPVLPPRLSFLEKDVRPVFFTTSTSLGLRVSWSGMTATYPDSMHLGFRRKEIAWTPIAYSQQGTSHHVAVPSLLATIDVVGDVASPGDASGQWLQYFATGDPATALALRQGVRQAMLARLDPGTVKVPVTRVPVLRDMLSGLKSRADEGDAVARQHLSKLDDLGKIVPSTFPFATYSDDPDDPDNILTDNKPGDPLSPGSSGADRALDYLAFSSATIGKLKTATKIDGTAVTAEERREKRDRIAALKSDFERQMAAREDIQNAFDYWWSGATE